MAITVVVHQPDFLPHLAFFERLLRADRFVILDDAQFTRGTKNAWQNRDRVKTPEGVRWLTVPVRHCPLGTPINQVELLATSDWRDEHLALLRRSYATAPYFAETFEAIAQLYAKPYRLLVDLNLATIHWLSSELNVTPTVLLSSQLDAQGRSSERLVKIVKKVGGTQYLSGTGARAYLNETLFEKEELTVKWQDFPQVEYPQLHGPFEGYLSSIDLLFNTGRDYARALIQGKA